VPVLIVALDSPHERIRLGAIAALVKRRSPDGHTALLRRFARFGDADHAVLNDWLPKSVDHMKSALHDAVLDETEDLCESACHMMLVGRAYEHLPTLVGVAENPGHRHSQQAAATLIRLTRLLHDELAGERPQHGRDPFFARRQVLPAIERSVVRYGEHRRLEIVDAFLLLVPPTSPTLVKVLSDSQQACHAPVVASLRTSAVTAILDLLTQLMHDTKTPLALLEIVAQRTDRKFLEHLLHHAGTPVSLRVLENMKRVKSVNWLQDEREVLVELDGRAQEVAAELATSSRIDRSEIFALVTMLLRRGQPAGRRAACDALARYRDAEADRWVLTALDDPEPSVRSAAVRQLRGRSIAGAMEKLVTFLDDQSAEIRDAARSSLSEFNFLRFESLYDSLDDQTRQSTGRLVGKVDRTCGRRLADMLSSPSPSTKLRGLEMVIAMRVADDVYGQLLHLLADTDAAVRADAAVALGMGSRADAISALRIAAADPHRAVREAAQHSLDQLQHVDSTVRPLVSNQRR
jgi:HEAT repeat protein